MRALRIILALAVGAAAYVAPPQRDEAKRRRRGPGHARRPMLQATVEETENKNNVLNLPESEKGALETPLEAGGRPFDFELNLDRPIDGTERRPRLRRPRTLLDVRGTTPARRSQWRADAGASRTTSSSSGSFEFGG